MMHQWRNWQTRTFEGRVIYSYGFKSRLVHQADQLKAFGLFYFAHSQNTDDDMMKTEANPMKVKDKVP